METILQSVEALLTRFPEPGVRYLALRDVLGLEEHAPQMVEARYDAHRAGPIAAILSRMHPDGYWVEPGAGYNPKYYSTVWSVLMLSQLGASMQEDARIETACRYVMQHALTKGGQFTSTGAPSGTADCLQGNLCWALLRLGVDVGELAQAFDWMARTVTGDGIAPAAERDAAFRYYAGKCGPNFACGSNNRLPCAWGAVKVMLAFAALPAAQRTPVIQRAIDAGAAFLLSIDPVTARYPVGYSSQPSGNWWKFGFPVFYVTDLLQLLEGLVPLGFGKDERLANTIILLQRKRAPDGTWHLEYDYTGKTWVDFGAKKQPNPWVTLRALKVLKQITQ